MLDEQNIHRELLFRNLYELDVINRWLGGHAVTLRGLERLLYPRPETWHITDIGCGGGDTLKAIAQWADKKKIPVQLHGVDMNPDVIDYASEQCRHFPQISFRCADYRDLNEKNFHTDISISALFTHHLDDEQMPEFLRISKRISTHGFLLNDLHRHWFAYHSIDWLTRLFSRSVLVKNDARLSVWRGFNRHELQGYLEQAGIQHYRLQWAWAFRWLLCVQTNTRHEQQR